MASMERFEGPIRGLRLPLHVWDMLREQGITTIDQIKAIAARIERFERIGPKTAQVIREELARVAASDERFSKKDRP